MKKKPVFKLNAEDRLDLVDVLNGAGGAGHNYVPEQERNFDAGYMPSTTQHKYLREETIGGKLYKVYQAWLRRQFGNWAGLITLP